MKVPTDILIYLTLYFDIPDILAIAKMCKYTRKQLVNNESLRIIAIQQIQKIFGVRYLSYNTSIIQTIHEYAKKNVNVRTIICLLLQDSKSYPTFENLAYDLITILGYRGYKLANERVRLIDDLISYEIPNKLANLFKLNCVLYYGKISTSVFNILINMKEQNNLNIFINHKDKIKQMSNLIIPYLNHRPDVIEELYKLELID